MTNRKIDITRRKVLGSIGAIGLAGAGAGMGTSALFSDQETFENNTLTAGELDLRVDWEEHYWDDFDLPEGVEFTHVSSVNDLADGQVGLPNPQNPLIAVDEEDLDAFMDATAIEAYPDPIDSGIQDDLEGYEACDDFAQTDDDLNPQGSLRSSNNDTWIDMSEGDWAPLVNLHDVKPGDFGELTLSFHLCDNPGYVWLQGDPVSAAENGHTEPEGDSDAESGASDESVTGDDVLTSEVELLDAIQTCLWYDDGDNILSPGGRESDEVDVMIVFDASGSMNNPSSKLTNAKAGAESLVDTLGPGAQVGLVTFEDVGDEAVEATLADSNADVKTAIGNITAGGSTAMGAGIALGQDELANGAGARSTADKVMVVLGNGGENEGTSPRTEASSAKSAGTTIYAIAYGTGADENLMEDISSPPKVDDGSITADDEFAFLGDQTDIESVFTGIGESITAGEQKFFDGTLRELLDILSDGTGIPLDGDLSTDFDELNDPPEAESREEFVNSTNNFIGLAWWVPRDVGNEIQSDSVGFDLGFYTEQARHNDGSGPTNSTNSTSA